MANHANGPKRSQKRGTPNVCHCNHHDSCGDLRQRRRPLVRRLRRQAHARDVPRHFDGFDAELTSTTTAAARLTGVVPVATVIVKDENLEAHLQSPEFFDAEQYPEIRFDSTDLTSTAARTLAGDLTIKGHTERIIAEGSVTGPLDDPFGNTKLGLQFETVVDRTKFGLNWNAPLPKGGFMLANEVTLCVDLELLKA